MILICHNLPYHATVKKDQFLDVVIFALLTNLTRKNHQLSFQSVIISTKNIIEATKHVLLLRVIQKVNTEQNNGKFLKYSSNDRNDKHNFFYLINFFFSSSAIKIVIWLFFILLNCPFFFHLIFWHIIVKSPRIRSLNS